MDILTIKIMEKLLLLYIFIMKKNLLNKLITYFKIMKMPHSLTKKVEVKLDQQ